MGENNTVDALFDAYKQLNDDDKKRFLDLISKDINPMGNKKVFKSKINFA